MAYSLGLGCNDDSKYVDPEAWWDLHFCCNQFFASSAECKVHRVLHPYMGAGGSGSRGGGACIGKKKGNAPPTVALLVTAPGGDSSEKYYDEYCCDDYFDEDCRDDDSDEDSENYDYEDYSNSEAEVYLRNMRNLVSLNVALPTKFKKSRSKRTLASNAVFLDHLPYKFSKRLLFSLKAVPQTKFKKSRQKHVQESSGQFTYICNRCSKPFSVKPEYLLHTAIIHNKCGACDYKRQAHQKTNELWDHELHFKSSPSCHYCSKGSLGDTAAVLEPGEEMSHPDAGDSIVSISTRWKSVM